MFRIFFPILVSISLFITSPFCTDIGTMILDIIVRECYDGTAPI